MYMDYYSALNSLSSQSSALDYASQTLLGDVSSTSTLSKLSSELSSDVSGITADAQASVTKITSAFDAKATAQERLVAGLEGGAMGIEAVKKTRESVKKYTEQEESNAKIKAEAKAKEVSAEPEAGGGGEEVVSRGGGSDYRTSRVADVDDGGGIELGESKAVELGDTRGVALASDRGGLPSVNPTETPLDPQPYTGSRLPVRGNDPTGWDLSSAGEGQASSEGASAVASASSEGAVAGESAVGSIEAGAGEIALAGGAGLDVVADAVAGAVALVGLGVGLYDLFDKSAENKEKKQEKKAEDAKEAGEAEAQANYDTKVSNLDTQYGSIRSNIVSNTHAGIAIGVQNIRNTYKSSGTF
jgi:hypothetical protein